MCWLIVTDSENLVIIFILYIIFVYIVVGGGHILVTWMVSTKTWQSGPMLTPGNRGTKKILLISISSVFADLLSGLGWAGAEQRPTYFLLNTLYLPRPSRIWALPSLQPLPAVGRYQHLFCTAVCPWVCYNSTDYTPSGTLGEEVFFLIEKS